MNETGTGSDGRISLPAVADLTQAAALKEQLERGLMSGSGIVVDAAAVQRISSPCLQVLVAAAAAFEKTGGQSFTIADPSAALLETVSMLGLKDALGLA